MKQRVIGFVLVAVAIVASVWAVAETGGPQHGDWGAWLSTTKVLQSKEVIPGCERYGPAAGAGSSASGLNTMRAYLRESCEEEARAAGRASGPQTLYSGGIGTGLYFVLVTAIALTGIGLSIFSKR